MVKFDLLKPPQKQSQGAYITGKLSYTTKTHFVELLWKTSETSAISEKR